MKELFLDKSLVTNPNVTGELVLVYIALRKVMSDEVPLFSKETSVGIVSLNKMAFVLTGLCTEYDSNLLSILKQGIAELAKEDYKLAVKSQSLRKKEIEELRSKGVRVNGVGYCNKLLAEILEEDLMEAGNRELEEQAA